MAKSLIFSSTILFFLFTSTLSRLQVDLPENDFTTTTTTAFESVDPADLTQLPESNIKTTTIILPSEKPETEPATYVELEPEETETIDSNRLPQKKETETEISASQNEKTETVESVPLTVITFRPINRRPLYRFGRERGCHGRRHHRFNQLRFKHDQGQRQDQTQGLRSYSSGMILSRSEDLGFDRHVFAKWPRFSHDARSFMNKQVNSEEINIRPRFHHHHHRFHHHHDHHEEEGEMKEHHRHEHDEYYFKGGFMKGIRKFLSHF